MRKSTRADGVVVSADGRGLVSQAGAVLLRETMGVTVLARAACQPGGRDHGRDAEGGRGLQLVAGLAMRWGRRRRGGRMMTWFELLSNS